ncbi:flagellar basal body rod protein FlgC [Paenirhodobacter populi]|uniref:Flagellar basal body rod protein FlgB n=1 Tax=Paenirhodobacter populi TaxID=2306993 RepID=A0A443KDR0_9RHOB|nr:flagellar basal body rod protein FlgC [Sinirhodobacter populi]RWR09028.1 flagellar basal body rod protein FlgC [Sinirhodobacter populi]RWR12298.1 flagellar basal body rod protein FlgC [Sinirhodobacter populi]RWR23538.1 flagellar basal body rod protein FlgC [Sinirhodobacter populi]RWR28232.1 flagellar basal body rod protein FlgC [Sinirhodobacter populi]RWR30855.1 flagellar basal body rod protein FlgC [Sinirhodobacter populi]
MNDFTSALSLSASGMQAQAQRLRHVAENVANADTPGYRRKLVSFEEVAQGFGPETDTPGAVQTSDVTLDERALPRIYDPGHPMADQTGYLDGSNVDLVVEIADAREAQRSYEANLRMFDQARQMSSAVLDLLRR